MLHLTALMILSQQMAKPEVRGTWVTTTANEAISSPRNTNETMRRLREIGLNTVYVEVWKDGYTEFPSETMQRIIKVPFKVNPSPSGAIQRDLLSETLIAAHRNQLIYVAWFEYGFMAAYKTSQNALRTHHDWLSLDRKGNEVAGNGFVWLNPLHPKAQELLIGIVTEAIKKYDLDGIQLDDRIVWPYIDMGYDKFTVNLYAKEHGGKEPPEDPRNPEWMAWRQNKVEQFSKRFVAAVRKAGGPKFIISLSPGPHPWALENYLIDWPAWSKWPNIPTWDEYVPQVYRFNYADFEFEWKRQVESIGSRNKDMIAGIRLTGDGPDTPKSEIAMHAQLARDTSSMGHCWWYSRGVVEKFSSEISSFYDVPKYGQAPHPRLGAGWRPAPIKAIKEPNHIWKLQLEPGKYAVIARVGDSWREIKRIELKAASTTSIFAVADDVEGLVRHH
jgi:uncharacterized lipoprotein YddW (UPF0748 family)